MKQILGVLLTSTILTTAALANGAPAPAACPACPVAAAADFTGFKLGVNLGYGHGAGKLTYIGTGIDGNNQPRAINNSADISSKGFIGGLHVGYDKQLSKNFMLGAEASFDYTGLKSQNIERSGNLVFRNDRLKHSWTVATVARAGFVHESTAFYGLVGWVATKTNASTVEFTNNKKTLNGVRFGGGIAHKMNKVVLGLEGTYDAFGKNSARVNNDPPEDYVVAFKPNVLAVKAKISYAF